MNWVEIIAFILVSIMVLFIPVVFVAQMIMTAFSSRAHFLIRQHPIAHILWLIASALVVFMLVRITPYNLLLLGGLVVIYIPLRGNLRACCILAMLMGRGKWMEYED